MPLPEERFQNTPALDIDNVNEWTEVSELLSNDPVFSDLTISSPSQPSSLTLPSRQSQLFVEIKFLNTDLSSGQVKVSLKLSPLSDISSLDRSQRSFLCYLSYNQTQPQQNIKPGDEISFQQYDEIGWISSYGISAANLKPGLTLSFKVAPSPSNDSLICQVFCIKRDKLLCCGICSTAMSNTSIDSDNDSLVDVTTFDINELDDYNTPVHQLQESSQHKESFSRKRSCLALGRLKERQKDDIASASGSSLSTSFGSMKRLKSLKNVKQVVFENKLTARVQNRNSLERCSSLPVLRTKSNVNVDKEYKELRYLFKQITEGVSNHMFVKVVEKFLLSDNETLTTVIASQTTTQNKVRTCYNYLKLNFPPFISFYDKEKDISSSSVVRLPAASDEMRHLTFSKVYRLKEDERSVLNEYYVVLKYPDFIRQLTLKMMNSISLNLSGNDLTLKLNPKLFFSGVIKLTCDDKRREYDSWNQPILLDEYKYSHYRAKKVKQNKFEIEYLCQDSSLKITAVFTILETLNSLALDLTVDKEQETLFSRRVTYLA